MTQIRQPIRRHIIVHGRVQSVGFRYFCYGLARKYPMSGWVRNLYNGTVELEIQGEEEILDLFEQEMSRGTRFIRVDKLDVTGIAPIENEKETFRVIAY